ncbi:MAG: hypothetical protein ACI4QS_00460 [Comamonas sp.]
MPHSQAQVFRCGNSYSPTPCADSHVVELAPAAPNPSSHHRQQARKDAQDWDRTQRELHKAETALPAARRQNTQRAECTAAERRIQKIDELAAKGGSAPKMEKLRQDRKATRDKQFRMGC